MADQAHEWTDEQIERLQRKFRREYNAAAREMRNKLDDWMKEYDEAKKDWQAKVRKGEAKQEDFDGWLSDMAHDHDFIAGMAEALARDATKTDKLAMDYVNDAIPEVYAENANFAAWSVERQLGYDTHAFDLYDQDTVRRMIAEGDIAEGLVLPKPKVDARKDKPWNQRKFTSALTQSILQGESIPNTAKRLQMVLSMDEGAAVRAARTAMTGAENAGRIDSYQRAQSIGIELEQEWLATHDERTRITHRLLDGEHVPVGERFVPDGYGDKYSIGFPGDPTALGEMVYNCRCTLVAWLPSIAEEDNRSWAKLPDGMTYDEWKHGKKAEKDRKEAAGVVDGKDMTKTWKPDRSKYEFDIRDIIHQQGFDGKPQIVDPDEFSRLAMAATDNGLIMQRAYGAPSQEVLDSYREALYNGEFYVDCSGGHMYGRGMYASWADGIEPTRDMQRQSERYAHSHGAKVGYVETMTLDRSAKVISYEELEKQWENEEIPRWIREGDDGVLAAALGYDAIRIDNAGEMVILNRTKLIIRRPE